MEDGNLPPEEEQKKTKLNTSQLNKLRKKRRELLRAGNTIGSSADYTPRKIPPKYGTLRCSPDNESNWSKETPQRRKFGFKSFVDLENIKEDVEKAKAMNIDFDVFQITEIASNFMRYWFQGREFIVLDTTIVGCWEFYFDKGYRVPNFADVKRTNNFQYVHVHARQRICCSCGREYLKAHPKRKTVKYERKADVADWMIEDLVYQQARFFGRPLNVLLITGDADFVELVESLRVEGIEVYLGKPTKCAERLKQAVKQSQQFNLWDLITFK
ncbi:hypothetical protein F2Q68_00012243 [Brassica cretica]|uniref:NYN domain-containing protein n=1 Tax=Brassica cretica TaxID=69181 RepID=A0A8S9KTP0_BRACR|nr:hypothetical protein F2Q68_00012243 [Brassica cretica]